jgi:hypothetical protein
MKAEKSKPTYGFSINVLIFIRVTQIVDAIFDALDKFKGEAKIEDDMTSYPLISGFCGPRHSPLGRRRVCL